MAEADEAFFRNVPGAGDLASLVKLSSGDKAFARTQKA